jgi:hypothetical protein
VIPFTRETRAKFYIVTCKPTMNSKHWRMLVNTFWTSRVAIAARIAEERRCPESWNELTAPEDYDLPLDKVEYQIRPAKWPWQVYII